MWSCTMSHTNTVLINGSLTKVIREVLISLAGSIFLTLASQVALPLPFTPIPLTLQTLAVFLLAGTLGKHRAMYSISAYLIQGCLGLPVFAGGAMQPLWFLGPKAGFLLSFLPAAYLIGLLLQRRKEPSLLYTSMALLAGQCAISLIGMLWLSAYVGCSRAFLFGVLPFLSGAAIKIIIGTLALKGVSLCQKELLPLFSRVKS
jgi:biotin transport system substrate-specific component